MCDLNLNNIRLKRPIIMMLNFLNLLGLKIKTSIEGNEDIFSRKNIDDIDNDKKSLNDWISKNIKTETDTETETETEKFKYKRFFKKIFTKVFTKIKEMYIINDVPIHRIGYTPQIHEELQETSSLFTFGKGGNQTKYKRKRNSKKKNHKRTKKNV
jgi:hypothetical protein